jgi:hypothetical protein
MNVSNWTNSSGPRDRKDFPEFQKAVLAAAEKIVLRSQLGTSTAGLSTSQGRTQARKTPAKSNDDAMVAAADVAFQIQEWLGQGLTPSTIQKCAGIDEATYAEWASGKASVPFARWESGRGKAQSFLDYLASVKAQHEKQAHPKPTKKS